MFKYLRFIRDDLVLLFPLKIIQMKHMHVKHLGSEVNGVLFDLLKLCI